MAEVKTPDVGGMPVWPIKVLAATVTADVILVVMRHWKGYDVLGKSLAVVLLAHLVLLPAGATWGRVRRYPWPSLLPMYWSLLLATTLFAMR